MIYDPKRHWTEVAERIRRRGGDDRIAGDDSPYYRYKRRKFVRRFLRGLAVRDRVVLELGCGPGGNLAELASAAPRALVGVDLSPAMLALAAANLEGRRERVTLRESDGWTIPLADRTVDLAFTVTALQHDTDPAMLRAIVGELCRVTRETIVLFEDTGGELDPVPADRSTIARPVASYRTACEPHGFRLAGARHLGLRASRPVHARIRGALGNPAHRVGEPLPRPATIAMAAALVFTRMLDGVLADDRDLTEMTFVRAAR